MARKKSARSKSPAAPAPPADTAAAAPVVLVLGAAGLVAAATHNLCGAGTSFCGTATVPLVASVVFAGIACAATLLLIPATRELFLKAGLFGIDLNKSTTARGADGELARPIHGVKVPEPMGLVTGTVYLMVIFIFIPFAFVNMAKRQWSHDEQLPYKLTEFITALLSITCMLFLGFGDDVLDLKWRHKFILPTAAALPMLMVYASNHGPTNVAVPIMLQPWLGVDLHLGPLYYIFMGCLSIFCTNSINILAGVNGLEVGQCVVIALSMLANNIIQLAFFVDGDQQRMWNNLFSIYILLPFLGVSLGLLYHNWFPSAVFVGDTYCYFAGMTFAVSGILGHNPKTLLLFHIPQVVNFVFSVPQLMNTRAIPCPRHRMPGFVPETGETFVPSELSSAGKVIFQFCYKTGICSVIEQDDGSVKMSNMTIICLVLHVCGPMREDMLTKRLLLVQVVCTLFAFIVRYKFAALLYENVE